MSDVASIFLAEAKSGFRSTKEHAERAIAQLDDADLERTIDSDANSIAVIMRHLAGNLRSRWTDFLISDGEKPNRDRDGEFEAVAATRDALMADWESGWRCLFEAVDALKPDDLARTVTIRSEPHTVVRAIERQTRHYAEHVGQIVLLAKHWRGSEWKTLSIPKGKSREFQPLLRA